MNRWLVRFLIGFSALGALAILVLIFFPNKPLIPGPVKNKVTSTILMPTGSDYKIDRASAKYDSSNKLLSFNVTVKGAGRMVVSEQPTPDQFTDIPQYYDKVLEQFGQYETFDVNVGSVYLTKPKNLNGKVAGVLNTKGTLMFARPDGTLSDDQWRRFFRDVRAID